MYNERDPVTLEEMSDDGSDQGGIGIVQRGEPQVIGTPTPSTPQQGGFLSNLGSPVPGTPRPQTTQEEVPSDFLPSQQMASMFDREDTTRVQFMGDSTVGVMGEISQFKGNLAVEATRWPVLFIACGTQIEMFAADGSPDLVGAFYAEPNTVTPEMREGAVRPNSPHDINMLSMVILCGQECLVANYDDGRSGLWVVSRVIAEVQEGVTRYLPHVTFKSDASVWGTAASGSLLALSDNSRRVDIYDLASLADKLQEGHYVDRVNLYCEEGVQLVQLPQYRSPLLMNNIPSVSLVIDGEDSFYITAGTIGYEVATIKFFTGERLEKWKESFPEMEIKQLSRSLSSESLDSIVDATDEAWEDSHIYKPFDGGIWIHRNSLGTHVWTVTAVSPQAFKQSPTLYQVHANKWANEHQVAAQLERDSSKARSIFDPQRPFYPAVRFTHYDIPTCPLQSGGIQPSGVQALAGMFPAMGVPTPGFNYKPHYLLPQCKKEARKMRQWYERYDIERVDGNTETSAERSSEKGQSEAPEAADEEEEVPEHATVANSLYELEVAREKKESALKDSFVIVTTHKSLYLCRHDDLFVNGACANVFSWEDIYGFGEQQFDRLSFAHYIPDLCVYICGSPIGAISVFRLTQKAGVYCMRQEWAFPDTSQILFSADRLRLLAGVAVSPIHTSIRENVVGSRERQWDEPCLRYRVTLIYGDGYQIKYEISGDEDSVWMV
ncbi:hypothetical protein CJU90_2495 [Yarrowia sp. C11]|nr:hypothetical protein CJU90_2495 [Yarrowia sp. C11]